MQAAALLVVAGDLAQRAKPFGPGAAAAARATNICTAPALAKSAGSPLAEGSGSSSGGTSHNCSP
jgi:hypothetical protein